MEIPTGLCPVSRVCRPSVYNRHSVFPTAALPMTTISTLISTLNSLLAEAGSAPLNDEELARFDTCLALLLRWNARTNLTAIREPMVILRRHFLESILAARALPTGIYTLLDFGSGAGFPGLPIAICRPDLAVTLAESQHKKAAYLREAVRTHGLSVAVHADRAQSLTCRFDCVTLRAVDRMAEAISAAARLVAPGGWLAILTTTQASHAVFAEVARSASGPVSAAVPERVSGTTAETTVSEAAEARRRQYKKSGERPEDKSIIQVNWLSPIALPPGTAQLLLLGQPNFA